MTNDIRKTSDKINEAMAREPKFDPAKFTSALLKLVSTLDKDHKWFPDAPSNEEDGLHLGVSRRGHVPKGELMHVWVIVRSDGRANLDLQTRNGSEEWEFESPEELMSKLKDTLTDNFE